MRHFWPALGATASILTLLALPLAFVLNPEFRAAPSTGLMVFVFILLWILILYSFLPTLWRLKSLGMFLGWLLGPILATPLALLVSMLLVSATALVGPVAGLSIAVVPLFLLAWTGVRQILNIRRPNGSLHAASDFIAPDNGHRMCPSCNTEYSLDDYNPDAEHIYCSTCKSELPRKKASEPAVRGYRKPAAGFSQPHPQRCACKDTMTQTKTNRWRLWLISYIIVCLLIDLYPRFGPPYFRYTGSDPSRHVWNLGWPMPTTIVDSGIHVGPVALPLVMMEIVVIGITTAVSLMLRQLRRKR